MQFPRSACLLDIRAGGSAVESVSFCFPVFLDFDCFFRFSTWDEELSERYRRKNEIPHRLTEFILVKKVLSLLPVAFDTAVSHPPLYTSLAWPCLTRHQQKRELYRVTTHNHRK